MLFGYTVSSTVYFSSLVKIDRTTTYIYIYIYILNETAVELEKIIRTIAALTVRKASKAMIR